LAECYLESNTQLKRYFPTSSNYLTRLEARKLHLFASMLYVALPTDT